MAHPRWPGQEDGGGFANTAHSLISTKGRMGLFRGRGHLLGRVQKNNSHFCASTSRSIQQDAGDDDIGNVYQEKHEVSVK